MIQEKKLNPCTQFTNSFSTYGNLKLHFRTHTGGKPYTCTQCPTSFPIGQDLKWHLRFHTGEKPYHCTQCTKSFSISRDLKLHLRIHTREKPYPCTHCTTSFSKDGQLKQYLRTYIFLLITYALTYCYNQVLHKWQGHIKQPLYLHIYYLWDCQIYF